MVTDKFTFRHFLTTNVVGFSVDHKMDISNNNSKSIFDQPYFMLEIKNMIYYI